MLTIRPLHPTAALALLGARPADEGIEKECWDRWSLDGTLLAFVAREDAMAVGLALAESRPRWVHVFLLEGTTDAGHLLLERLVRSAGERDVSVWCPAARMDVRELLEQRGFARLAQGDFLGRPSYLYRLDTAT